MNFLFIMGGSGSGKTTLANMLNENASDKFKFIKGTTTRVRRENETDTDYEFISDEQYERDLQNGEFIGESMYMFSPNKYGYRKSLLDPEKTNVMILSIEGFLNAVHSRTLNDNMHLCYIDSDKPFVDRLDRDFSAEDRFNKSVLVPFTKKIDENKYALYINSRIIRVTSITKEQIQSYYEKIINSD